MMPGMYPEQDVTMLSVQTNYASLIAQQNYNANSDFQTKTITAITSGYRINQSGDDAAGLVQANQYRSQVAELSQGVLNANNALSTLQIADGAMNNISTMLDRLKTLATQAASLPDGPGNDAEFQSVLTEIDREAAQRRYVRNVGVHRRRLSHRLHRHVREQGGRYGLGPDRREARHGRRCHYRHRNDHCRRRRPRQSPGHSGRRENDLAYATSLANSQIANTSDAEGAIRDADMASEAANLTKAQVLSQASLAAMAQANAAPQGVLTLLKG